MKRIRGWGCLIVALPLLAGTAHAQATSDLERERAEFTRWLIEAPNSPYRAVALQPIGRGITLGPAESDVPLTGALAREPLRLSPSGAGAVLEGRGARRVLPRHRVMPLEDHHVLIAGSRERSVAIVYAPSGTPEPPAYYSAAPDLSFTVGLIPPDKPRTVRILALDGVEVDAIEAGFVEVPVGAGRTRLRVYRIPEPGTEESELMIYFRDETNGTTTYPAGRFVPLVPVGSEAYRLDFNRSRNPFCAYRSVYPCPAPWPGNAIEAPVTAGEKYLGGGLKPATP